MLDSLEHVHHVSELFNSDNNNKYIKKKQLETPFALNVYDYFMNHHNTKPQQIDFNHFNNSMHSNLSTNFNCDSIGAKKNTPKSFIQLIVCHRTCSIYFPKVIFLLEKIMLPFLFLFKQEEKRKTII